MCIYSTKALTFGVPFRQSLFVTIFTESLENLQMTLNNGSLCQEILCDAGNKVLAVGKQD